MSIRDEGEEENRRQIHKMMDIQSGINIAIGVIRKESERLFSRGEDAQAVFLRNLCNDIRKEAAPYKKDETELRKKMGLPLD